MVLYSARIKWIRLKRICEDIAGRPVKIIASTEAPDDLISRVKFTPNKVTILINLARCKELNDVIRAVAHEMVHVTKGDALHDDDFDREAKLMTKFIERKYTEGRK